LGGGRLGPDLSNAVGIYGEEGLAETLADIPSMRTMGPIFSPHPLTPGEQADLVAFLISEADHPEPNKLVYILIASVVGFLAAIAIGAFYWRGRLGTVRADLVNRSRTGKQKP
jgi:hypothetical protein